MLALMKVALENTVNGDKSSETPRATDKVAV